LLSETVIPAKAGIQAGSVGRCFGREYRNTPLWSIGESERLWAWIPAFAGMTSCGWRIASG